MVEHWSPSGTLVLPGSSQGEEDLSEGGLWCSCCIVHSNSTIVLGSDQVAYPCFRTRWLGLRNLNIVPDRLPLYNCSGRVFHS